MKNNAVLVRAAAGVVGGLLVVGGAGAAVADEAVDERAGVEVKTAAVGALTLSVASGSTSLTEVDAPDADIRQFAGTLPEVTVTDDRHTVPAGAYWYVTGQSSALVSGQHRIDAGHLGWTPRLITTGVSGEVAEAHTVLTVLDAATPDNPHNDGLVGGELLSLSLDSQRAATLGTWKATADLVLKVPKTVAPGAYAGTITLTLWEDQQPR